MNEQSQPPERPAPGNRRRLLLIPVVLALVTAGVIYWALSRGKVVTDDAQVEGHLVPVNVRVSGYVRSIHVHDNQPVKKGDLLVELDRRDLNAKLLASEANLATQQAQAAAARSQLSLVGKTAPAGEEHAAASVTTAESGVAAAQRGIALAQAQSRSAEAGVRVAREGVATAETELAAAKAGVDAAEAGVKAAHADVTAAQAAAKNAADDAARYRELFAQGAVPEQQRQAMETASIRAEAALVAARERVESARAAVNQAGAKRDGAEAGLEQAKGRFASAIATADHARVGVSLARTALSQAQGQLEQALANQSAAETAPQQISVSKAQALAAADRARQASEDVRTAQLQLSYTRIKAPVTGQVSAKTVQLDQYVQPGQSLMAVVPLKNTWVVANYKETQIEHVLKGQRAEIEVDTYPGMVLRGRVDSIGAATGAKFSLLPPENATGNFVKVVQRIPVKIVLDRPLPRGVVLRPGQNVVATVFL